jgi:predicted nuclease of predicted toxin-antitoxin system
MLWLFDQGIPRNAAKLLRDFGFDAIHVGEIGMAAASDDEIIRLARSEDRVIVTLDSDFHAALARSSSRKPSVIRLREEGLKAGNVRDIILLIHSRFAVSLAEGCVVTATSTKARIRMLPINPSTLPEP